MSSLLRSDAREIFEANQEAAWRAFRDGQPCPVVVRVPPQFVVRVPPQFVPLGADVAPQKQDRQHVIRFVAGSLGDQPAYCVMVDDTPALEDCVAPVGSLAKHVWDVHAAQVASPGPSGRGTAYMRTAPVGYTLNPNSGTVTANPDYDVATRSDAARLSPAPGNPTSRANLFAVNMTIAILIVCAIIAVALTWLRHP